MSRTEKKWLGSTIGIMTIILTIIAMASGGAAKCGKIEQTLTDHGKRLDKIEPVTEVVYELNGKVDIIIEMLKDK